MLSAERANGLLSVVPEVVFDLIVPPLSVMNSLATADAALKESMPWVLMVVPSETLVPEPRTVDPAAMRVPLLMVIAPVYETFRPLRTT